jgi:hypothetical protein
MRLDGTVEAPLARRTVWKAFNGLAMLRLPFKRQRVSRSLVDYCIISIWLSPDLPLESGKELRKNEFMNRSRKWTSPAGPAPYLPARAQRRFLVYHFEESQASHPCRLYTSHPGVVEGSLCMHCAVGNTVGNMGHYGVILHSLYTKELGVSECTCQNHDQFFTPAGCRPFFALVIWSGFRTNSGIRLLSFEA